MDYFKAFYLALLQGLTEFLPISSSAHLILMPVLFEWPDQGLPFDLAVHLGTLLAVVTYFRNDLILMIRDWLASIAGPGTTDEARLVWYVIIGTVPVCISGLLISGLTATVLRSPLVIALTTIVFAGVLWLAEKSAKENRFAGAITWKDALMVGGCQALALIPGTSRSGITITAGLFLGFKREFAARFSFLLSIPAIALPGLLKAFELIKSPEKTDWEPLLMATVVSGIVAYLTIGMFLRLLDRIGLMPFVIYRFVLGFTLLAVFYTDLTVIQG